MRLLYRLRNSKFFWKHGFQFLLKIIELKRRAQFWFYHFALTDIVYSFTRDKVQTMLKYITEMPPEDCSKDRGYTLPFHSDMIFQFQNKKINDKFFSQDSE